jgi:hypothetical protein
VKRGLKLGFGIPLVLLGLFATLGGVALMVLVGPDGTFTLPQTHASSSGNALLFDAIYIRGNLPASGNLSTTVTISAHSSEHPIFIGVGPSSRVATYLHGVSFDRVVQVNWPGGVRTENTPGSRTPPPPGDQAFWEAMDEGTGERSVRWTVSDGDWSIVVMNEDGSRGLDVFGSVEVKLPILGPASVILLIVAILMLVGGIALTVSGARTPKPRTAPPGRPPAGPSTSDKAPEDAPTSGLPPGPPPRPDDRPNP